MLWSHEKEEKKSGIVTDEQTWELISNRISVEPSVTLENSEISKIIGILTKNWVPGKKTVFVLSDLEGMSNDEISELPE